MPPWCVSISILGLKVEAVQGKQVSLERTETSVGHWEWWHDPGVPLAFPVEIASFEMRRERREFFPDHAGKDPSSRAMRRKRGSLDVGGTLVLPLEWTRVCRGTSLGALRV